MNPSSLSGRNYRPCVCRQQPSEFQREIQWPFRRLYLDVCITPLSPGGSHVIRTPFHLHLETHVFTLCCLQSKLQIIASGMMRLPILGEILYQQILKIHAVRAQSLLMPD